MEKVKNLMICTRRSGQGGNNGRGITGETQAGRGADCTA